MRNKVLESMNSLAKQEWDQMLWKCKISVLYAAPVAKFPGSNLMSNHDVQFRTVVNFVNRGKDSMNSSAFKCWDQVLQKVKHPLSAYEYLYMLAVVIYPETEIS